MRRPWNWWLQWSSMTAVVVLTLLGHPWVVNAQTTSVEIANTPTTAVPVVPAPAGSQLYRARCLAGFNGVDFALCTLEAPPAGHTLFVETISITTSSEGNVYGAAGLFNPNATTTPPFPIQLPMFAQFPTTNASLPNSSVGLASVRVWVRPGVKPYCQGFLTGPSNGEMVCVVFGYLAPTR